LIARMPEGRAGIPSTVVMLTADAFGVLPPIARLTPEQAMFHFLSATRPSWPAPRWV
jgi:ATP-dependent phosphoenolpyruvate carboxykinase